jgi:flagellar hook assembly protein FlgD
VKTLVDENMEANSYVRNWDGRSDNGAQVSSGIYFYKMVAGEFSATKKAVLLK